MDIIGSVWDGSRRAGLRDCVCVNASRGLLKGFWGGHLQPTVVCYPSHDSWPEFELIDELLSDPAFITAVAEAKIRRERKRRCCHIWSITFINRLSKVCWVKNQSFIILYLTDSPASLWANGAKKSSSRKKKRRMCCAGQATKVRVTYPARFGAVPICCQKTFRMYYTMCTNRSMMFRITL